MTNDASKAPLADVTGKTAFITGGSSGIGLGMARAFSAAGMKVVFTYMREEHRDRALALFPADNPGVHAIRLDTADRDAMPRAADEAERRFGNVHMLVNNAGIGITSQLSTASWQDWDWAMNVNVDGVFNGIHCFVPRMLAHGEGSHILTTSSSGGLLAGTLGVYCATKYAVMGMMESLRVELAGRNIGTSVLCPGLVRSDIMNSERNRPQDLANEKPAPDMGLPPIDLMAVALDPVDVGEMVLAGIRNNDLFIFTHEEFADPVRVRGEALLASFPHERAPQARYDVVATYVPDIYEQELKHRTR
ncbi:MAG: SDR family NAD(P)-dependent oxidoreductase [Gammaproteobacteria bacterium]|nr:SDR family NAD(P)-dependent oxidoreductase [Gammaproteobacteria bacterium]